MFVPVPRPSETSTRVPEEDPNTSQRPKEVISALQTSVSEMATNDAYIVFYKMRKSKEVFVALLRISARMWAGQGAP